MLVLQASLKINQPEVQKYFPAFFAVILKFKKFSLLVFCSHRFRFLCFSESEVLTRSLVLVDIFEGGAKVSSKSFLSLATYSRLHL